MGLIKIDAWIHSQGKAMVVEVVPWMGDHPLHTETSPKEVVGNFQLTQKAGSSQLSRVFFVILCSMQLVA